MMETPLSTILAPADTILQLLMLPKFIYFCAVFAFEGFKNGITLTHSGMRKGIIAKVYAVFYSFSILFSFILIPDYVREILATDGDKIKQALFFAMPIPQIGYIFIGISLFLFLFMEGLTRFGKKKIRKNEYAQKIYYSMLLLPLAIGIQSLLGLPHIVFVGIFVLFAYFGAFANPQILRKALPVPS
jgi:hypothetical protein